MSYLASGHFNDSKIPHGINPVDSTYGCIDHKENHDPQGATQPLDNSCGVSIHYDAASSHYINPEAHPDAHTDAHTQLSVPVVSVLPK